MICSKCGGPRETRQRYCNSCHAAYQRAYRVTHLLTEAQRIKDRARSIAGVYLRRGKIERQPCERCGARAQMHHPDYSRPLFVVWLCRPCHLAEHSAVPA